MFASSSEPASEPAFGPETAAARSPLHPLRIEIIDQPEAFEALAPHWRALTERVPGHHYCQTFDWTWRWWDCVARKHGRRPHIAVGWQGERAALIWPLAVHSQKAWRVAKFLGSEIATYGDVLVEPGPHADAWIAAAWQALLGAPGVDAFLLQFVREDARTAGILDGAVPAGWKTTGTMAHVEWSDWPDWQSYYQGLDKRHRQEQARNRRRLAECGRLAFEIVETAEEAAAMLDWMLARKTAWYRHKGIGAPWLESADCHDFLLAVVADAQARGTLFLTKLSVDDQVIAGDLAFIYAGRQYGRLGAFDFAWKSFAPGKLLREECMKWSFEHGQRIFDFRLGEEGYKRAWANREVVHATYLFPRTLGGRLYVAWFSGGLRYWIKKRYEAAPAGLRRFIGSVFLK